MQDEQTWARWHSFDQENPNLGDRVEVEFEGRFDRFPDSPHNQPQKRIGEWKGFANPFLGPPYKEKRWRHVDLETAEHWQTSRAKLQADWEARSKKA